MVYGIPECLLTNTGPQFFEKIFNGSLVPVNKKVITTIA